MIKKIIMFITVDVWRIPLRKLPKSKSFLLKELRIILLAFRGFDEDKCSFRASALTFYTLLSIVPVVAMAFGIAKGFGMQNLLQTQLMTRFPGHEEVIGQVIGFANSLLDNTRGGMVAGIGVAVLFWTVIKVLGNIEKSFNEIWGITENRKMGRKFADYLSIMLICPLLLVMSSSITVLISSQVKLVVEKIALLGPISPLILTSLKILPYAVIWTLFSFIYIFMPNTRVRLSSGILAGIVAGTIYQMMQLVYINFQIGVSKYNAIYGSFAALPLFLMSLQISWLIVLFGAEISFARQNVDTYEFEPDCLKASHAFKKLLILEIMQLLIKQFCLSGKKLSAETISLKLEIPIRLARQVLSELVHCSLVAEVASEAGTEAQYQPAMSTDKMTIQYVVDTWEHEGTDAIPISETKELGLLRNRLKELSQAIRKAPANVLLKNL